MQNSSSYDNINQAERSTVEIWLYCTQRTYVNMKSSTAIK